MHRGGYRNVFDSDLGSNDPMTHDDHVISRKMEQNECQSLLYTPNAALTIHKNQIFAWDCWLFKNS
jgi:hypothetical protein